MIRNRSILAPIGVVFIGVILIGSIVFIGGVEAADQDPVPSMSADVPDQVQVGETFQISVQATNDGGDAGGHSTISISSPTLDSSTDDSKVQIQKHSVEYSEIKTRGDQIYNKYDDPITADYLLAEVGTVDGSEWPAGYGESVTVEITPEQTGTIEIYTRVTLTDNTNETEKFTDPDTSSYYDQQNYRVIRHEVEVTETNSDTCVTVQSRDENGETHPTTLLLEQLDGDYAKIGETEDDSDPQNCNSETVDSYYIFKAPPGDYLLHMRNDGSVNERWGIHDITVPDTDSEFFGFSRSGIYATDTSFNSPRDSKRFEPGETAEFDARLYNGGGADDVTTKLYVYPAGQSRPGTPTKILPATGVAVNRHESISSSIQLPDEEGEYTVEAKFVSDFTNGGKYVSEYVNLGSVTVKAFEPPRINDRTPESGQVTIHPSESKSFEVRVSDPDSSSTVTWYVNGQRMSTETEINFDASGFSSGEHTITAVASDNTPSTTDDQTKWSVEIPPSPTIASVEPGNEEVTVGEPIHFSVDGYGSDLQYQWEIEDNRYNGESVEQTFRSAGTKKYTVTVTNKWGVEKTKSFELDVREAAPYIDSIFISDNSVNVGENIRLRASATDPAMRGVEINYTWEIAGSELTGNEVSTKIYKAGKHEVKLTVENSYGAKTTKMRSITVQNDEPSLQRISQKSTVSATAGTSQKFEVNVSNRDASAVTIEWFVDNEKIEDSTIKRRSKVAVFDHTFTSPGTRTVKVIATDGAGKQASETWELKVRGRPPHFDSSTPDSEHQSILTGESLEFSASAYDPDASNVHYEWELDGTKIDDGPKLRHTFSKPGKHRVRVVVFDDHGDRAEKTWSVTAKNFRLKPKIETGLTSSYLRLQSANQFITASLRNPEVNSRTARVEIAISPPNGVIVSQGKNIDEGGQSEYVSYAVAAPGEQVKTSISLTVNDESLDGEKVIVPYQIIYYPENQSDSYQTYNDRSQEIAIGDATRGTSHPSKEDPDSTGLNDNPTNGEITSTSNPGFGFLIAFISILLGSFAAKR